MNRNTFDLSSSSRSVLAGAALLVVVVGVFFVLQPFLNAIVWAAILALSSWPIFRRLDRRFPGRRTMLSLVMTILLALLIAAFVVPLVIALANQAEHAFVGTRNFLQTDQIHVPDFIRRLPIVGERLATSIETALNNRSSLLAYFGTYQESLLVVIRTAAEGILRSFATLLFTLLFVFFIFRNGVELARQIETGAQKLGGPRLLNLISTIQSVVKGGVYGILLTALAQGLIAGTGFALASAPFPVLLGFATLVFALVPFGPPLIYIPVALLFLAEGRYAAALFIGIWGAGLVSTVDNFIRPYFISQTTQMPLILSLIGVIGGLATFGLLGIFVGPAIIAVALALWYEFIHNPKASLSTAPAK